MSEPDADVFAKISADRDRARSANFTPSEVHDLRNLAREVRLEHPIFGALEIGWVVDLRDGLRRRTAATVMIVGNRPHAGTWKEVTANTPVDGRLLLEVAREDRRVAIRMLAMLARHALIEHATHEIDEMILVAGERLFDPHGLNAAPTPDLTVTSAMARALQPSIAPSGVRDVNDFASGE